MKEKVKYPACPKCNKQLISWFRVSYLPDTDMLKKTCGECGYSFEELPHDRPLVDRLITRT